MLELACHFPLLLRRWGKLPSVKLCRTLLNLRPGAAGVQVTVYIQTRPRSSLQTKVAVCSADGAGRFQHEPESQPRS